MDPLLHLLRANALAPREEMARQLDLTVEEVGRRIAALEASGAILGYQAVIDDEKAGHDPVTAVIEVKITPERGGGFDRLASRIARFDQVVSCHLMSGGYDLLVVVQAESLREVARFVAERLSTVEGVLSSATHFRLKTYKENGLLRAPESDGGRLAVTP